MEGEASECWGDPAQPGKWGPCRGGVGAAPLVPFPANGLDQLPIAWAPALVPNCGPCLVRAPLSPSFFVSLCCSFPFFPPFHSSLPDVSVLSSSLCFCPSPCLHLSLSASASVPPSPSLFSLRPLFVSLSFLCSPSFLAHLSASSLSLCFFQPLSLVCPSVPFCPCLLRADPHCLPLSPPVPVVSSLLGLVRLSPRHPVCLSLCFPGRQ